MQDGRGKDREKNFAQKIAPLAEKITKYINNHQDDAAQEERWRTVMKRETMKRFQKQREAIDKQREAIDNRFERQSSEFRVQMREEVQKIETVVHQKVEREIQALQDKQSDAIAKVHEALDKQGKAIAEVHQLIMGLTNPVRDA